jgi:hypothetical protein
MNAVVDQEREGGLLRKLLEASFPSGACNAEAQQAVAESGMGNNLRGLLAGELPSLGITAKKSEKGAQADGQTVESFCSALIAGNCKLLSDFRDKNDSKLGRTYQDYLLSLRELERTLRSIEDSQKAAHLALEEVKKQALSEGALYRTRISREKFFDELERTALFGNSGGDAANVSLSLSSMLEANQQLLESTIWNRLLNLAFEDLQEQWATGPLDQWKQLLNGGQDNGELKCAEVEKWLTGELTEFVNTLLEPLSGTGMAFYDNEKRQEGFLVDNAAVEQISKLIKMGSSLKCCAGDAQDSAEPEIISLDLDNFSGVNIIRFDTSTRTAVFDSRTGKWSWSIETRGELGIEFQLTGGRGTKYTRLGGSLTEILERRAVLSGKVADIRLRPQEGPDGQSGGKIRLILSDDAFAKREKQGCSDSIDIRRLRLPERLVKRDFSSLKMTRE